MDMEITQVTSSGTYATSSTSNNKPDVSDIFRKVQLYIARTAGTAEIAREVVASLPNVSWDKLCDESTERSKTARAGKERKRQERAQQGREIDRANRQRREVKDQRILELRALPYVEYLKTPEWKNRRYAALKRAGDKCQVCNHSEQLDVHHRTYERLGNERYTDLLVLCRTCHTTFHKAGKLAK